MKEKMDQLLEALLKQEILTETHAGSVDRTYRDENGARGIARIIIDDGFASEKQVLQAQSELFGIPCVDLAQIEISDEVIAKIPPEIVKKYKIVPIEADHHSITIAQNDPLDFTSVDSLRLLLKKNIKNVLATQTDIDKAMSKYYKFSSIDGEISIDSVIEEFESGLDSADTDVEAIAVDMQTDDMVDDAPVIKLVSLLVLEAFRSRASDIHLEPFAKTFRIRYRIDGVLHEVPGPPKRLQGSVVSRIKIMAKMDIAEKRLPQDGRIKLNLLNKEVDFRVSTLPSTYGETIVMRILDKSSLLLGLPELGFMPDDEKTFEKLLMTPNGIVLVTGPTGSGKTTTLYAALNYINRPDRKLITIEDPVEYQLRGVNQVQVQEKIGLTFSMALRACLRQAPDVIMVGEIRDFDTASISIQAALTGHLVFSTLHTNDAPRAITRLIDMGVQPYLVASALQAIIAQRLVRTNCEKCRQPYVPSDVEIKALHLTEEQLSRAQIFKGEGCRDCGNTGYKGRVGIYEILRISDNIRNMIFNNENTMDIREVARQEGMKTLREDGARKFLEGWTTIEEVFRVTQLDVE